MVYRYWVKLPSNGYEQSSAFAQSKGNSDKIPNWASIIPSTKKYDVQLVIGQKNLQSVLLKSFLDLLWLRSHYSPIKGQDNVYPSICNKNDAKKPELSSTRYGEKLLVCIIKIERLEMLFSHFGVLYFVVLLRRRKKKDKFCNQGRNMTTLVRNGSIRVILNRPQPECFTIYIGSLLLLLFCLKLVNPTVRFG